MAKKKPGSSTNATAHAKVTVTAQAKPPVRNLAMDEIGLVAGMVWQLLHGKGEQSLTAIKSSLDAPSDFVLAAIGWLAREGKLDFKTNGRSLVISLR